MKSDIIVQKLCVCNESGKYMQVRNGGEIRVCACQAIIGGQTDKDIFDKMTIVLKEDREARYLEELKSSELLSDAEELFQLIGIIQKTIRPKINSRN